MEALVGAFNQEKALVGVGAFSGIVATDESFAALLVALRAAAPVMWQ